MLLITSRVRCLQQANLLAQPSSQTDNQIAYYQQLLRRNPRNAKAYFGLGDALIRKARESGDPSYFNRAEEALKKSLEIAPHNARRAAPSRLRLLLAPRVRAGGAARAQSDRTECVRTATPTASSGDALLEVGRYAEAQAAYAYMMELDESLYSYSRLAGLKSARGDVAGAISDLERAIAIGKATKNRRKASPGRNGSWARNISRMEIWRRRNHFPQVAGKLIRTITVRWPGLAQVRAAQQNFDEAIELYQKAIAILPMPEYAAALGNLREGRQARRRTQTV